MGHFVLMFWTKDGQIEWIHQHCGRIQRSGNEYLDNWLLKNGWVHYKISENSFKHHRVTIAFMFDEANIKMLWIFYESDGTDNMKIATQSQIVALKS